jgi:hypothetical protein
MRSAAKREASALDVSAASRRIEGYAVEAADSSSAAPRASRDERIFSTQVLTAAHAI